MIILGGQIKQGSVLKSREGMVHARDCQKVCAYLVNSQYYATLAQQMSDDLSATPEEQWQPLLHTGKWLACYPSICYQRAGYSDIEKKRPIILVFTLIKLINHQLVSKYTAKKNTTNIIQQWCYWVLYGNVTPLRSLSPHHKRSTENGPYLLITGKQP